MKLGLGLPINPKNFNPLNNVSLNGKKVIEMGEGYKPVNAVDLLDALSSANLREGTNADKVKILKSVIDKIIPI